MHWSFLWFGYFLTWALIPFILLRNKPPVSTLAWVWAVILFPYLGPIFYFFFGDEHLARKKVRASREMSRTGTRQERTITAPTRALLDELQPGERKAIETLRRAAELLEELLEG